MLRRERLAGIGRIEAQITDCHRLLQRPCNTSRSSRVPLFYISVIILVLYSR